MLPKDLDILVPLVVNHPCAKTFDGLSPVESNIECQIAAWLGLSNKISDR